MLWKYVADFFTPSEVWLAREILRELDDFNAQLNATERPLNLIKRCDIERSMIQIFKKLHRLASVDSRKNFLVSENALYLLSNATEKPKQALQQRIDPPSEKNKNSSSEEQPFNSTEVRTPVLSAKLQYINYDTGELIEMAYLKEVARVPETANYILAVHPFEPISATTALAAIRASFKSDTKLMLWFLIPALHKVDSDKASLDSDKITAQFYSNKIFLLLQKCESSETSTAELEKIRLDLIKIIDETREFLSGFLRKFDAS